MRWLAALDRALDQPLSGWMTTRREALGHGLWAQPSSAGAAALVVRRRVTGFLAGASA
jgi:hypothetical protein